VDLHLGEMNLTAIVDTVFSNIIDKGAGKLGSWALDKQGLTSTKKAFQEALNEAFEQFEQHIGKRERYGKRLARLFGQFFGR
jgi:hypothetical protein